MVNTRAKINRVEVYILVKTKELIIFLGLLDLTKFCKKFI